VWGVDFNGLRSRSVAQWFSKTGTRETGSSEEGGLRRAAVTRTVELAVATHRRGQDCCRRDAWEDSFYSCAAREGDGSSRCSAQR
jgi:hypothetical protein